MHTLLKEKFFVFNPKSYLYGQDLLRMADAAERLAIRYPDIAILFTCPMTDIYQVAQHTQHILVCAQHLDGMKPGRGMGSAIPEALYAAGVRACFLNHAERPMTTAAVAQAVQRAREFGIISIVCSDSLLEAQALAGLKPDVMLCEPTDLIGTGTTSDTGYMTATNQAVRAVHAQIAMMQAAGISTPRDVYRAIQLGADGTGCTSGILQAANPMQMMAEMVEAVHQAMKEEKGHGSL